METTVKADKMTDWDLNVDRFSGFVFSNQVDQFTISITSMDQENETLYQANITFNELQAIEVLDGLGQALTQLSNERLAKQRIDVRQQWTPFKRVLARQDLRDSDKVMK